MTAPIVGAAFAVEGLLRCLQISSTEYISSDIMHDWIGDLLAGVLAGFVIAFVVVWAHRLLAARANTLLREMDQLSLALITRYTQVSEHPQTLLRAAVETAELADTGAAY